MMLLAALVLHVSTARDVDWSYGCGGNCAIRNEGHSTVALDVSGGKAVLIDEGWHELGERHPGGGMLQTTRWRTEWRGTAREAKGKLVLELRGEAKCTRDEVHDEDGKQQELQTGCPRTPAKIKVTCLRAEVAAAGRTEAVPVWQCRSPLVPPGTVQPWVFGIDVVLDERLSGEPRPEATYTVR